MTTNNQVYESEGVWIALDSKGNRYTGTTREEAIERRDDLQHYWQ